MVLVDLLNPTDLAAHLMDAPDSANRTALFAKIDPQQALALAEALKDAYDSARTSDPAAASAAAATLEELTAATPEGRVHALARWVRGKATLHLNGDMEGALTLLDEAAAAFAALNDERQVAEVQLNRMHALAMLGRYDEAMTCGRQARDTFLACNDLLATGKVEQNLGNIEMRQDRYAEAESHFRQAQRYLRTVNDESQLIQTHVCLALALTFQHKFRPAIELYQQSALEAEQAGATTVRADIAHNLGMLWLIQGQYEQALAHLEQARRLYSEVDMLYDVATVEQQVGEVYLELNMADEALALFQRIERLFAEQGLRADHADALVNHGWAGLRLQRYAEARQLLEQALHLFAAEENTLRVAVVYLTIAQIDYATANYEAVLAIEATERTFVEARAWVWALQARWLRADSLRALGQADEAQQLLQSTLRDAARWQVSKIQHSCYTSLGLLTAAQGDYASAEAAYQQAVDLVEAQRSPLPADEFRAAFVADKLTPYYELMRLNLHQNPAVALAWQERARSRALLDLVGGFVPVLPHPSSPAEEALAESITTLRAELNWLYSQLFHTEQEPERIASLQEQVQQREAALSEATLQVQQAGGGGGATATIPFDLATLQAQLGNDTALVAYSALDGMLLAFVVTDAGVVALPNLAQETGIETLVQQVRFQIDAMRHGAARLRQHSAQLSRRAQHYLGQLYDMLLRPLTALIGERRLAIVPHRALHYLPFHALFNGQHYLIEEREVCYAPSATLLHYLQSQPLPELQRALLLGVPDARAPHVGAEVQTLAGLFSESTLLQEKAATVASLHQHTTQADLLHLACHGQFRHDSPLFSALRLGDGWFTARDAYSLELPGSLVTLSACETGVSALAPGDELLGLTRGFFAAGAGALLVSLWTVDDATTADLMSHFYQQVQNGATLAAALRSAQCALLAHHPHPFFWSPFVLQGRW
ncbi:MAG: CHAT domain-containing protein [Chloroflexaceae bacterium]|jgi:CHAT domain-containing protein|nr:CHAT domain-containing protein [Chloroflexaceae bacterium]